MSGGLFNVNNKQLDDTQESREAEIAQFHHAFFGQENVFWFDVTVDAAMAMTVAHCLYQLPCYLFRQYFRHSKSIRINWLLDCDDITTSII